MSDTVDIQPTASVTTPLEQDAAHAADPLANPPAGGSRLPAGSTLEVVPGLHVPHPHAEVNLPGKGDPRLGNTLAVSETLAGKQTPLAEEVKPRTLVVTKDPDHETGTPAVVQLQKK